MKAARIHDYGHSDQIQVEEVDIPDQGAGEVLVRITAAGVNPIDWKIREGYRSDPAQLPLTLGQDFAGTVISVGEDVREVEGSEEIYGFAHGSYAEYAVVSPQQISSKPRTVDNQTAAGLPTPGLTALQIVTRVVDPKPDQTILIHGAAGGVGSIATQLVLWKGAHVIANAHGRDAAYLESLGVARVIDYTSERFEDKVRDVDAVIDLVGGDTLSRSYDLIKRGGVVVTTVGPLDEDRVEERAIRGVQFVMQKNGDDLVELARLVDQGVVKPRGTRVLPLAQAREGQELNETGREPAKVVLAMT